MREPKIPFPEILDVRWEPEFGKLIADRAQPDPSNVMERPLSEDPGHVPLTKRRRFVIPFRNIVIPDEVLIYLHD